MQRFRGFKGFLFLILFLPVLVMGVECTKLTDIDGATYESDILYAADSTRNWVTCKDSTFRPSEDTNRIEALKMALMAGGHTVPNSTSQCYGDIATDSWMNPYVCYAKSKGLIVANDNFYPADFIEYSHAAKMILVSITSQNYDETQNPWYKEYMDKFSLYGFDDAPDATIERGYFTHILRAIALDPNRQAPTISSIVPTTAKINEKTTFTVDGSNLPSTLAMYIPNCDNMQTINSSSMQVKFTCTPINNKLGIQSSEVKDKAGGKILKTFDVNVIDSAVTVTSITPSTVQLNERTTFTVHGANLPSNLDLNIDDFDNIVQSGGSATELEFYATPIAVGVKTATMRDEEGGTILQTLSVTVEGDDPIAPIISSISPSTANINEETTFTVTGENIPSTLAMFVPYCENMTALGGDDSTMQFSCTPNTAGIQASLIKDQEGGTILKSFTVDVTDTRSEYMLQATVVDVGGASGQLSTRPIGLTNCRAKNQGTCQAPFQENEVVITAHPEDDSLVLFRDIDCTHIDGNSCTVAMGGDRSVEVSFTPKDDTMTLTLDSIPQSLKIKPNEPISIDFKITENRDDSVYVLQMNLADGKGAVNCKNNFSMKDVVTCEASYASTGKYILTATAYADSEMKIKSNMVSIPIEVSTTTDEEKFTGHQNQEHLKAFWTNNPTTAKEAFIVDTATGTQNLNLSFMPQSGQIDLALGISYNSGLAKDAPKGVLGQGWSHSYGVMAHIEEVDNSTIILHTSSSRKTTFKKGSDGIYLSVNRVSGILPNYYDKISQVDGNYVLENSDKTKKIFKAGKLVQTINKKSEKLFFTHNDEGKLSRIFEPLSKIELIYRYNDDGSLDTVSDNTGRVVSFHYSAGHLTSITDVDGTAHIFTYNDHGEMWIYKIENDSVSFNYFINVYDELGRVTKQRDGNGNDTDFDYDESSYAIIKTTVTTALNDTRTYTYNSNYQLLEFKDELGYITTNKYTLSGLLRSTTNPKGLVTTYSYDDEGRKFMVESPNNTTVYYRYDADSNLETVVDELGFTTKYTYKDNYLTHVERDVEGDVKALATYEYEFSTAYPEDTTIAVPSKITTTTAKGNKSIQTFQFGHLTSTTTAEGVKTSYKYTDRGELEKQILHAGGEDYTSTFEYNDLGQVIKATDPEDKTVSKTYSIFGSVETLTDAKGNVLTNKYDKNGNLLKSIAPKNTITEYKYNSNNQLTSVTDANGHTSHITYDFKGRKKTLLNNEKQKLVNYVYDRLDTVIKTNIYDDSDNKILASINEYDIPTRYTKTISHLGKLERAIEQHLDSKGRVFRSLNSARESKDFKYENHFDTITSVTAYGTTTYQTVDDEANLKTLTDLANNTNKFEHESQKDRTLEESALGKTHKTTYNSQYLVETFTNAREQTRNFTYYKNGWLKTATSDGAVWTFVYDNNGNLLTMSSDKGKIIKRSYDVFNRVISYTDQNGNTLGYVYDNVGNLLELTYPDGKKVTYTYDSSNRLETVTDWNGVTLVTYSYTRQGKLLKELRDNGSTRSYTYYNGIGELESIKDTKADGSTIVAYAYEYDIKGNIIKETKTDDTKSTIFDYTYTPKGILEKVLIDPQQEIYNVSNLMMTHNEGDNRADTIDSQAVSYDDDGNIIGYMLKGKQTTLTYDEKSRLKTVGDVEHIYSVEDAKIETIAKGKSTTFVVDTNRKLSQLLVEESSTGEKTYHIYGAGLVATLDKDGTHYYHYDYRGSTVALSDSSGDISDRYAYLPYGKMINHKGMSKTRFLYVGKYGIEKEASGLYYMRARYYDADIKRFISKDSLIGSVGDGLSLNRYLYANGNPISFIDSTGYDEEGIWMQLWGEVGEYSFGSSRKLIGSIMSISNYYFSESNTPKERIESGEVGNYSLFYKHYRDGNGQSVDIDINDLYKEYETLRNVTAKNFDHIKTTDGTDPEISITLNWTIYGHTNVAYNKEFNYIYLKTEGYDFDWKEINFFTKKTFSDSDEALNQSKTILRNIATVGTKVLNGRGQPFSTHFTGKIYLDEKPYGFLDSDHMSLINKNLLIDISFNGLNGYNNKIKGD